MKKDIKKLIELKEKAEGFKKIYAEIDRLTAKLALNEVKEIDTKQYKVTIVDNISNGVMFKTVAFKRFEAKIVKKAA